MSQVHLTSLAVNGLPSCHLTPRRSLKVSAVLSSSHDHSVARSGTIELRLVCATCWSYMTRLLKTPCIGPWDAMVASSWIDMLAGLSKKYILRVPPGFCADAGLPMSNNPATAAKIRNFAVIRVSPPDCGNHARMNRHALSIPGSAVGKLG